MRFAFEQLLLAIAMFSVAHAQQPEITGQWIEPTGSIIRVDHCGPQLCMWIVAISPKAPAPFDIYNPDPAKQKRSLCGMEIGRGFTLRAPGEARDGILYDPKSGKTYHGQLKLNGNRLELRGYIGIPLLGQTQIWTRPPAPVRSCAAAGEEK
jgi:uncharacterized protein (DUF2147 family)